MSAAGPLFGGPSARASSSRNLVEFKAGKMEQRGTTVSPDKRKGMVCIYQDDQNLLHFAWKDRSTGNIAPEDDLIVFPDEYIYKPVPQCTTGRVFLLKFKSDNRNRFFWMQEPKSDKDEETCTRVNDVMNNPPPPGQHGNSGGGLGAELANLGDSELSSLLGNLTQSQLMQLLGSGMAGGGAGGLGGLSSLLNAARAGSGRGVGGGGSSRGSSTGGATANGSVSASAQAARSATPATPAAPAATTTTATAATTGSTGAAASSAPIQLTDLQQILSGFGPIPPGMAQQQEAKPAVDLAPAITYDALQPLLSNQDFMTALSVHLPPGTDVSSAATTEATNTATTQQIKDTVQSPQFQQALSLFSTALSNGQLGPLIAQFGLGESAVAAANTGDMEAFVKAVQESGGGSGSGSAAGGGASSAGTKKSDDENMQLD